MTCILFINGTTFDQVQKMSSPFLNSALKSDQKSRHTCQILFRHTAKNVLWFHTNISAPISISSSLLLTQRCVSVCVCACSRCTRGPRGSSWPQRTTTVSCVTPRSAHWPSLRPTTTARTTPRSCGSPRPSRTPATRGCYPGTQFRRDSTRAQRFGEIVKLGLFRPIFCYCDLVCVFFSFLFPYVLY